ncbi:LysR family transcriptional regulator [Sphingomonas sp. PP-CE-3G-477]|uniref:LysR family transcriptional regulator n=1 Tax=Sphingomonas sp. PP-CE-3G-477 TaxID=2135660 RepID=UPI000D37B11D|nr:LysR family transcriptional regulator [Sphingomonas sp. PP-CE-3G-477]PTQ65013.1 LysR family transcriptional regulator [Sphingomonas sp. PP-CE-3G-477]
MNDTLRTLRPLNSNLLYALHAILNSPTLTGASLMMARSQPAMSMALRRLRDHFGDELVLYGNPRRLTAMGEALRPRVGRLLREIDDTFNLSLNFDPATARGTVSLTAPEPIELMYLSRVVPRLLQDAPGVEVRLLPFSYGPTEQMFERGLDVAVVPETMVDPLLSARTLFSHDLCALVWAEHPVQEGNIRRELYEQGRHVAVFEAMERSLFAERMDDPLLASRRIVARTGHHAMLPHLIIGTDLIATTSSWLAQYYVTVLPVRTMSLPHEPRPSTLVAQWQPHRRDEPLIHWIVDTLVAALDWPRGDKWR